VTPASTNFVIATVVLSIVALSAGTISCGRRGLPRPPQDILPETILDLRATPNQDAIVLTWSRPDSYVDGSRMRDLTRFEVQRADDGERATTSDFHTIGTIVIDDSDRFRQLKRFTYEDTTAQLERTYRYIVVAVSADRYRSAASNEVRSAREDRARTERD